MVASMALGEAECHQLLRAVEDRLAQVTRRADGGTPAGLAANDFVYMRRGRVLRKLYRPHLASKAGAALALRRGVGVPDASWGRVLDESSEAGYIDFAEPGEGFRPLPACPLPLDFQAVEQLRDILKGAETAGWRIDESSLFDSLWYSAAHSQLVILGAEGERGDGGLSGGMPATRWREVLGVPRSVLLNGNPLRRWLWRQMIHPTTTWMGRLKRRSRRWLSGLRRLFQR